MLIRSFAVKIMLTFYFLDDSHSLLVATRTKVPVLSPSQKMDQALQLSSTRPSQLLLAR